MSSSMTPVQRNLIISSGAAALITGFLLAAGMCSYETNDDMAMIRLLSGQQGITATPDAVFMSLPLSSLLYLLYKFYPTVPWYGLMMYGALITGCAIGLRVIAEAPAGMRSRIICILTFLGFYMAIATNLNFASVSLFLWFCVSARIAQASLAERAYGNMYWLYGCLLGFSYMIRPDIILYVASLFSLPVIAALWLTPRRKGLVAVLLPLVLTIMVALAWAQVVRNTPENAAYNEFNKIRAVFTDTSLSELNRNSMVALNATGWNIYDYRLARQYWWLHDGSLFSTRKLNTFITLNKSSGGSLFNFQMGMANLREQKTHLCIIVLTLVILLAPPSPPSNLNRTGQRILSSLLAVTLIGMLLLTMVRFPERVSLPVFVCLMLFTVVFRSFLGSTMNLRSIRVSWALWGICGTIVLTLLVSNYRKAASDILVLRETKTYSEQSIQAAQLVAGKDAIFLSTSLAMASFGTEFINPLKEYRDMTPFINMPSGWLISSPGYNSFLRANGLIDREHLVTRLVDNPRIVLAFWDEPRQPFYEYNNMLLQQLQLRYGPHFPGATLTMKTILDRRTSINGGLAGWVFFTIKTAPGGRGLILAP